MATKTYDKSQLIAKRAEATAELATLQTKLSGLHATYAEAATRSTLEPTSENEKATRAAAKAHTEAREQIEYLGLAIVEFDKMIAAENAKLADTIKTSKIASAEHHTRQFVKAAQKWVEHQTEGALAYAAMVKSGMAIKAAHENIPDWAPLSRDQIDKLLGHELFRLSYDVRPKNALSYAGSLPGAKAPHLLSNAPDDTEPLLTILERDMKALVNHLKGLRT